MTAFQGDRIVVEVGFSDLSGNTPEGQYRYGAPESVGDIAVDETTTTSGVGWVEFSSNISFVVSATAFNVVPVLMMRLIGN